LQNVFLSLKKDKEKWRWVSSGGQIKIATLSVSDQTDEEGRVTGWSLVPTYQPEFSGTAELMEGISLRLSLSGISKTEIGSSLPPELR
jgi:hypothetical protein